MAEELWISKSLLAVSALSAVGEDERRNYDVGFLVSSTPVALIRTTVAFKVYDVDRDGFISNGELFLVLKMMVGNNLKVRSFRSTGLTVIMLR